MTFTMFAVVLIGGMSGCKCKMLTLVDNVGLCLGLIPVAISQITLGRTGDFLMCTMTVCIVVMAVSAQIHSLSAIFVYDVYQTYISPFYLPSEYRGFDGRSLEISHYMSYNRRSVFVRHVSTIFFAILAFPAGLVVMAIPVGGAKMFLISGIVVGSSVLPVCMAVVWHRTTGLGVVAGVLAGMVAGIGAWFIFVSTKPGGFTDLLNNTGPEVLITALASSVVGGGVVCALISLCCGGLAADREELEWEKCRRLDNPIRPWVGQYATDFRSGFIGGYSQIPTYHQIRQQFRSAEVSAYLFGTLLTVLILLVWPALMLLASILDCPGFAAWTLVVIILGVISAVYVGVMPPLAEIIQLCYAPSKKKPADDEPPIIDSVSEKPEDEVVVFTHGPPEVECQKRIRDDDDDSSLGGDNSDGLNVLSDPRQPPRRGARQPPTRKPTAPQTGGPVAYPLSLSTSLQPTCMSCVDPPDPYCVAASDIPTNGLPLRRFYTVLCTDILYFCQYQDEDFKTFAAKTKTKDIVYSRKDQIQ